MCGIAGIVGRIGASGSLGSVARSMADVLVHRGPDGGHVWHDEAAEVALAHRRLAIIDLSKDGDQPMVSASGRYVISYNGEIYNFQALRARLEALGERFRGKSDTEVLLAVIERDGIDEALKQSVGMFAIALWDRQSRKLTLARDRLGEKPLYWAPIGCGVIFGSELRSLLAVPGVSFAIDRRAVTLLLRHNYIPAPWSIYENVFKLEPGAVLTIANVDGAAVIAPVRRYWDVAGVLQQARSNPFTGSLDEAVVELDRLLGRTIRDQMISDVPLGAFLSGGIDSSTIVALMQANSSRRVETYSIGFRESGYDEAGHARAIAGHLGTRHTEMYVNARDAIDTIPELPGIYDEPFSDSSQIPTLLVCRMARRHVTVALSGDGGDEVFGGYNRYIWARDLWRLLKLTPFSMRRVLASSVQGVSTERWDRIASTLYKLAPARLRYPMPGERIHKLAQLLAVRDAPSLYHRMLSHWKNPGDVVIGAEEPTTMLAGTRKLSSSSEFIEYMMELDLQNYLPDDILVKVDRAAMSASLETRVPLLDHRILEFAASLPLRFKSKGRVGKRILREVLYRYVPPDLVDRPKAGFAMPIAEWLRGPLRDWAEELLSVNSLNADGIFHQQPIRDAWEQHLSGRRSWAYHLWDILMFQSWLRARERPAAGPSPRHA